MNINNQAVRIFLIICLIWFTGLITYFTYSNLQDKISFIKTSYKAEGTVVQIVRILNTNRSGDYSIYYYFPVISYSDSKGSIHTFQSAVSVAAPQVYHEGQKLALRIPYAGGEPRISKLGELWAGTIFMIILTLVGWFMVYVSIFGGYFKRPNS